MSVISGGIFSKPRGKTGGIVFGAARTRNGKLATARELVKPSNPNTADQQTQRTKFKSVLSLIRKFGASVYQTAWNRSIGQLPGFQSMMSIYLGQINSAFVISLDTEINLGTVPNESSLAWNSEEDDQIRVTWTPDSGEGGNQTDEAVLLAVAEDDADRNESNGVVVLTGATRGDGVLSLNNGVAGATYQCYFYFIGTADLDGQYSIAKPISGIVVN